ncbi:hypothetical protein FNV43_RR11763 [Rhamnella rubrinervis]|uniref:PUM-HD domain-containing protein n=1 Tax=Rhamnella rubrinervis TaxID=2594499 RepID=A0A8K0H6M9_9ROSA|nr:hypothetical protein FNV43_RR11763 [Rhamnella rubrinervis]
MNTFGHRSLYDTKSFDSPQSPLPETLDRRLCPRSFRRENSSEASLQNPFERPVLIKPYKRLSLPNGASGSLGQMGLLDCCVGSDIDGCGCFLSNPYSHNISQQQALNLNSALLIDYGQLLLRREGIGESLIPPSSNANELSSDFLRDHCGVLLNDSVHKKSDISVSDVNNRPPYWLQEQLEYFSLEYIRGKMVSLAKDQFGCRILQRIMEGLTNDEEINIIFFEVIEHVGELMIDPYGNYVVQKLVELCSEEQRTQILLVLTRTDFQLVTICLNMHGTRAVQKLLESLTSGLQISIVMKALSAGVVALTKSTNGHHVIQFCLRNFSEKDNEYLLNEVADNCFEIATDKSGCCVLQQCIKYAQGELRERLVADITTNAVLLAEDRYGNYVVQYLLELRIPQITENLLRQLKGSYAFLSCNKYGSNVVEKCLLVSQQEQITQIVLELITSPNASMLLLDPYGNYVIQSALSVSKGFIHKALQNLVHCNSPMMRSNLYGKKVLSWFRCGNGSLYVTADSCVLDLFVLGFERVVTENGIWISLNCIGSG